MTKLENKIKEKIKNLEGVIERINKKMNNNEEFKETINNKEVEIFEYEWWHNGQEENYKGRLEAMKDLLGER